MISDLGYGDLGGIAGLTQFLDAFVAGPVFNHIAEKRGQRDDGGGSGDDQRDEPVFDRIGIERLRGERRHLKGGHPGEMQ